MMPETPAQPHRGTLILILGIAGICCCVVLGIVAWVMGSSDLKAMAEGRMDRSGEGLTQAGKICGMVAVAINVLALIGYAAMIALGLAMSAGSY